MAGITPQKYKGASATKAKIRHMSKDKREFDNHSNPHIDTSLTHLNTSITEIETGKYRSYEDTCALYDELIEQAFEAGTRKRKDLVTCVSLEFKIPKELENTPQQNKWFLETANIVRDHWGAENFIEGFIDVDEKHIYLDAATKEYEESRNHIDLLFVPRRADGKLSSFDLLRRKDFIQINKQIQAMSLEKFGVNFNVKVNQKSKDETPEQAAARLISEPVSNKDKTEGAKLNTGKSVEDLKYESALLENEADTAEHVSELMTEGLKDLETIEETLEAEKKELEKVRSKGREIIQATEVLEKNLENKQAEDKQLTETLQGKRAEDKELDETLQSKRAEEKQLDETLQGKRKAVTELTIDEHAEVLRRAEAQAIKQYQAKYDKKLDTLDTIIESAKKNKEESDKLLEEAKRIPKVNYEKVPLGTLFVSTVDALIESDESELRPIKPALKILRNFLAKVEDGINNATKFIHKGLGLITGQPEQVEEVEQHSDAWEQNQKRIDKLVENATGRISNGEHVGGYSARLTEYPEFD